MPPSRRAFLWKAASAAAFGLLNGAGSVLRADESDSSPVRFIHDELAAACERAELKLLFQGETPDEFRAWQRKFRAVLAELLGDFDPPERWTVLEESRREFDDHRRYELVLQAENVPAVPIYLLVPKGVSEAKPAPAVLCVHGHGQFGHHPIVGRTDIDGVADAIESANYDYGLQFVRRGYVVAAPCMVPFGRRVDRQRYGGNDPCAVTFVRMQALGQLPMAANLRDLRWTLDLLQSRPEVDGNRLGCAGLSYGGRMTMLVSAMDERIQVAAVSGALNLLQERAMHRYSCGSQIVPGLLNYGDYSEIGSLIAPRPCVWEVGSRDGLITKEWADLFRERLRRAYAACDASEQLRFDDFEGGHRFNGEVAFRLFERVLEPS